MQTLEENEAFVRNRLGAASSNFVLHELKMLAQMRASSADGDDANIRNWAESIVEKE